MARKRLQLVVGLVAVIVSAGAATALAQGLVILQRGEVPISPATPGTLPGTLNNETTGTNPLTGLPCSGQGSLAVSGAGGLADTALPPPGGDTTTEPTTQLPSLTSVFGSSSSLGAC